MATAKQMIGRLFDLRSVMVHSLRFTPEKFGTLLGYAPGGVAIYSSHYASADAAEYPSRNDYRSELDGIYLGYKWQCVEFARRWLYLNHGYVFDDVSMAYDIFNLHDVLRLANQRRLPLQSFLNGSKRPPQKGCMLIWKDGGEFEVTGHVAIVTEVGTDYVRVAEQNVEHNKLPEGREWSRQLPLWRTPEGGYVVAENYAETSVLGWVIQTSDPTHAAPRHAPQPQRLNLNSRFAANHGQHLQPWLDERRAEDAAFVRAMHGHRLSESAEPNEHYRYFRMAGHAERELTRATNELHLMFLHATDIVLADDNLLAHFNLPRCIWPRIRNSWTKRQDAMITGRFDFCVSPRGIKVYEYNADSAACYMEAGRVQQRWAEHFGVTEGQDPAPELTARLTAAFAGLEIRDVLHLMQDVDAEETYHTLYIKRAAEGAGIRCKIITGVAGLHWGEDGEIMDADGDVIHHVWKTWAWETALDQLRAACEEDDAEQPLPDRSRPPKLMDVLLRPDVMVHEPLWTLIPSNKAILPILWHLFHEHPYLLNSQFELNDTLADCGYVIKPIAGRCGANIQLYDNSDTLLNATAGRFDTQDQIYQELWPLPCIDGLKTQVCTFAVRGKYAGSCVRVDTSLIITTHSDLRPLRIVDDEAL